MSKSRVSDIIHHAARLSNVTEADIRGARRHRGIVRVRQAVCLVASEAGHSCSGIGRTLDRDHSTVIHATRTAAHLAGREPGYRAFVEQLRSAARDGEIFAAEAYSYQPYAAPPRAHAPTFRFKLPPPKPAPIEVAEPVEKPDSTAIFEAGIAEGSRRLARAIMLARAA